MTFVAKNYVDQVGPDVDAAWLNQLDQLANNALESATTIPELQAILGIVPLVLPVPVADGGTGAITAVTALANLGGVSFGDLDAEVTTAVNTAIENLYPQIPAETAALVINPGASITTLSLPPGNMLRYGADPTGVASSSVAAQMALDTCWLGGIKFQPPGGAFLLTSSLIINHANQLGGATGYLGQAFNMSGVGAASTLISITTDNNATVFFANTNITLLRYQQYIGVNTGSGCYNVNNCMFLQLDSTATVPVVQLDVLGEYGEFKLNGIYNAGTGPGLTLLELTKGAVSLNNIVNRDEGAAGVGSSRVGVGIFVQGQYSAGLGKIFGNTVRGWLDGMIIGGGVANQPQINMLVQDNECSLCYRGITDGSALSTNQKTLLLHNYFEGMEGTYCIKSWGVATSIRDNNIQTNSGAGSAPCWTTGIDVSATGGYCVVDGNIIGMPSHQNGAVGINANAIRTSPITITNNTVVVNLSTIGTGCSGVLISGTDPVVTFAGNNFNPNTGWTGTNNLPFNDLTTASDGSSGSGLTGLGFNLDAVTNFPVSARGATSLWINPTALTAGAVAANAMTLGPASYYKVTFGTAQTINSFAGITSGQKFALHVTNGNATFTQGASIKLAGSASYTPGANGAILNFINEGGVAVECEARVVF